MAAEERTAEDGQGGAGGEDGPGLGLDDVSASVGREVGPPGAERVVGGGVRTGGADARLAAHLGPLVIEQGGLLRQAASPFLIEIIEERRAVGEAEEK